MSSIFQEDASANQGLIDTIVQTVLGVLDDPTKLPQNFKGWLPKYLEVNPPLLPISQISGFSQFTAQYARVDASQTTTSTSFTDLATVGPAITGLPTGQYVLIYGGVAFVSSSADTAFFGPNVAGVAPSNTSAAQTTSTAPASIMSASLATISVPNSTVKLQYAIGPAGTATFLNRWLIVLRYANA